MDYKEFKKLRYTLGLSLAETGNILGASKASVAFWQAGTHEVPSWVELQLKAVQKIHEASWSDRNRRRSLEDSYLNISSRLCLSDVPDGWLYIAERLLTSLDQHLPEPCKDGQRFTLKLRHQRGGLEVASYLDLPNVDASKLFWKSFEQEIQKARSESAVTCACCGNNDSSLNESGWILPLCGEHRVTKPLR